MARPIEPSPALSGQDPRDLPGSLEESASLEEIARRQEEAR